MGAIVTTLGEWYTSLLQGAAAPDGSEQSSGLLAACAFGRDKKDPKKSEESEESREDEDLLQPPNKATTFPSPGSVSLRPRALTGSSWDGAESPNGSRAPSPRPPKGGFCTACRGALVEKSEDVRVIRPYGAQAGEWVCSEQCWRAVVSSLTKQNAEEEWRAGEGRHVADNGSGRLRGDRRAGWWERAESTPVAPTHRRVTRAQAESDAARQESGKEEEAERWEGFFGEDYQAAATEEGPIELIGWE
jgi:hypothetical protein